MTDTTDTPDVPAYSTEAYAAVEKAAGSRNSLYVPSVLEHAAQLLTDLWAAGERHGVTPAEWGWATDLAGGALDVVSRQYERPEKDRTYRQILALQGHLIEALASDEIGLIATLTADGVIVERGPHTPRGGYHGDANIAVGIYSNSSWDFAFEQEGAPVMSIVAPVSKAGASQVAEIIRDFVRGELGNPFRR